MIWILYTAIVLLVSGFVGFHLGRFREAYTEMTGMMAGMTMGMLNGFLLGYTAAAISSNVAGVTATVSLFWGNLFGILLGVLLGAYFGRAGGLMGIMDGSMGGVMGGSMGAMLAAMLTFPEWALFLTAVVLLAVYLASMLGLVVLIEKSAPGHAALHVLAPYFTRAVSEEASEKIASLDPHPSDHYAFLGVLPDATGDDITEAYVARMEGASPAEMERAERALVILTDPVRRAAYDRGLQVAADSARPDCCPPPRRKKVAAAAQFPAVSSSSVASSVASALREKPVTATATVQRSAVAPTTSRERVDTARKGAQASPARQNGSARGQKPGYAPSSSARRKVQVQQKSGLGPGPLIGGGLVVLVLLGSLVWFVASLSNPGSGSASARAGGSSGGFTAVTDSGKPLSADFIAQLRNQAVASQVNTDSNTQTLNMAVNGDISSYNPKVIKVKQGVPLHINLSVEGRDPG